MPAAPGSGGSARGRGRWAVWRRPSAACSRL